jgi:cytochrome c553
LLSSALAAGLAAGSSLAGADAASALYREHCAACHGESRLGGIGPALLPENLERLRRPEALKVIREGRVATQMPAFGDKLSADEAQQLAEWIYSPVTRRRYGGSTRSAARRSSMPTPRSCRRNRARTEGCRPAQPVHRRRNRRPSCVVLDGDSFERLHRFPSRYALHGGPKFSPDGRFVYFASRDGWISKFDIYNLVVVAEIRAGLNTRNAAVSGDGKWVMVANYLPHNLVVLDAADLSLVKIIPTMNAAGDQSSRVRRSMMRRRARVSSPRSRMCRRSGRSAMTPTPSRLPRGWCTTISTRKVTSSRQCSTRAGRCSRTVSMTSSSPRVTTDPRFVAFGNPGPGDSPRRPPKIADLDLPGCRIWARESPGSGVTRRGASEP